MNPSLVPKKELMNLKFIHQNHPQTVNSKKEIKQIVGTRQVEKVVAGLPPEAAERILSYKNLYVFFLFSN